MGIGLVLLALLSGCSDDGDSLQVHARFVLEPVVGQPDSHLVGFVAE